MFKYLDRITFFFPSVKREGSRELHLIRLCQRLTKLFGGCTRMPDARGYWGDTTETVTPVVVFVAGADDMQMVSIAQVLCLDLDQECFLVETPRGGILVPRPSE